MALLGRRRRTNPEEPRTRFGAALLLLVLAIVGTAFVDEGGWAKILVLVLEGGALLLTIQSAEGERRIVQLARAVVFGGVALGSVMIVFGGETIANYALGTVAILMAVVAPVEIVRRVRREPEVNLQVAMGALLLYLLIGIFYVFVYRTLGRMDPPFFVQTDAPNSVTYTYFAYVTLTTVGYGDFTARSDLGRMLAVSEALIGQLYLVSVVALVMSSLGNRGRQIREELHHDPAEAEEVTPPE